MKVVFRMPKIRLPYLDEEIVWCGIATAIVIGGAIWIAVIKTPLPSVIQ